MLDLYEKLAIKIKTLEPALSVLAVVLFIGTFLGFSILPKKLLFVAVLIMLWVGGIALIGHMFAPQKDQAGNQMPSKVRASSGFMRCYALIFMSVWLLGLLFMSIQVVKKLVG